LVRFGRPSVQTIEVLSGLSVGDRVILSDMSKYAQYNRVRLR
jgi:HlyD family secretion protein